MTQSVRGYASGKDDYLSRLRTIEGQLRGLQKMVEEDRWCPHIVTQVASATGALQEVAVGLLNDHVQHCVVDAAARGSDVEVRARLVEMAATIRQWCGYDPAHLVASGGGAGPSRLPGGDPGRRAAADPGRPRRFTEDGTLPGAAGRGDHQVLPAGVCPHSRDLAGLRACTSSCARARSWVGRAAPGSPPWVSASLDLAAA